VFDGGYDAPALSVDLADTRAQLCVRIRDDRVLYADPVGRPGGRGRTRRHGARFACHQPSTWPPPTAAHTTHDAHYGHVQVQAWSGLHPKLERRGRFAQAAQLPIVRATIIRIQVQHLPRRARQRHRDALWLWWAGPEHPDLDLIWRAYLHRFDIEHTFRFLKHVLGWTLPALRSPEQADRWTAIITAGYTQLRLARPLVLDHRLPWERPQPQGPSPTRVRRDFPRITTTLIKQTKAAKFSRPGPGRPTGRRSQPAPRHPVPTKATKP
jgi:hypothetical protein